LVLFFIGLSAGTNAANNYGERTSQTPDNPDEATKQIQKYQQGIIVKW